MFDTTQDVSEHPAPAFYTIGDVARFLRVSERTVRRWVRNGVILKAPTLGRTVRIPVQELVRLSERRLLRQDD